MPKAWESAASFGKRRRITRMEVMRCHLLRRNFDVFIGSSTKNLEAENVRPDRNRNRRSIEGEDDDDRPAFERNVASQSEVGQRRTSFYARKSYPDQASTLPPWSNRFGRRRPRRSHIRRAFAGERVWRSRRTNCSPQGMTPE